MKIEESATKLSRNPLGIIALFILLIYGFATLLFGFVGDGLTKNQKWCFVLFLIIFPVIVLFVFEHLVVKHHRKLYAPGDFKDEKYFMQPLSEQEVSDKISKEVDAQVENLREIEDPKKSESTVKKEALRKSAISHILELKKKREEYTKLALDYYSQKYDYKIEKHVFFDVMNRKFDFDGVSINDNSCHFFNVKYHPTGHILQQSIDSIIFNSISVMEKLRKTNLYEEYRFRTTIIIVVDTDDREEKRNITSEIRNMVATDLIRVGIKVLSVSDIKASD